MTKHLAAVLVLLFVVGVGQADEKDIIARLENAGGRVCGRPGIAVRMPKSTTDADLGDLCELRSLVRLGLSGTQVTDSGLRTVADLRGLRALILSGTAVSDKGLRHLESRSNLQSLDLTDCPNVTDEGLARLKKALPHCDIER
jgi:Leucine Rich repeat